MHSTGAAEKLRASLRPDNSLQRERVILGEKCQAGAVTSSSFDKVENLVVEIRGLRQIVEDNVTDASYFVPHEKVKAFRDDHELDSSMEEVGSARRCRFYVHRKLRVDLYNKTGQWRLRKTAFEPVSRYLRGLGVLRARAKANLYVHEREFEIVRDF